MWVFSTGFVSHPTTGRGSTEDGDRTAGSRRAQRFLNLRAQMLWHLRELLEDGKVALPPDEKLADELCAIRWTVMSAGKIQIEANDELRSRLGRSPDRADAVAMASLSGSECGVALAGVPV